MFAFSHATVAQQIRRKSPSRRSHTSVPFTLLHRYRRRVVQLFDFLYHALCNEFLFSVDEIVSSVQSIRVPRLSNRLCQDPGSPSLCHHELPRTRSLLGSVCVGGQGKRVI